MAERANENDFTGFHSEWNLGSPGGWYYQLLTQRLGRFIWNRICRVSGFTLHLDFEHPIFNTPPFFRDMMYRQHRLRFPDFLRPGLALLAEEETLEAVVENRLMVEYLDSESEIDAVLAAPGELEKNSRGEYHIGNKRITAIFCDFNNAVIANLVKQGKAGALPDAIADGITVNPRGMEPVGSKGVFEAVTGELAEHLSPGTVSRTPWTRRFFQRSTEAPDGSRISDLVQWTRQNWNNLVLKPEHGYSGKGVFVGPNQPDPDKCIQAALDQGEYIVQQMIPPELWAELYPELDENGQSVVLRRRQTDFRCFVNDRRLIGFVGRYGGIPTNVGMGGGTQAIALTQGSSVEAARTALEAVEKMPGSEFKALKEEVDQKALSSGLAYLKGPIPQAMRPRIISRGQLIALENFALGLWQDCVKLEKFWHEGLLDQYMKLPQEEKEIALKQPWNGTPALIASDGLYSFGADLLNK